MKKAEDVTPATTENSSSSTVNEPAAKRARKNSDTNTDVSTSENVQTKDISNNDTESDSNKTDFVIEPPSSPPPPPSPTPLPPLGPDDEKPKDPRIRKRKFEDGGDDEEKEEGQIIENSWYKDYSAAMQYKAPPKRYLNKVVDLQEQYEDVDIISESDATKKQQDNDEEEGRSKENAVDLEMLLTDKDPEKKVCADNSLFPSLKFVLFILCFADFTLIRCIN